jgi:hypothetical protein
VVRNISTRDLILPLDKGGRLILPVPRAGHVLVPVVREGLGFAEGINGRREVVQRIVETNWMVGPGGGVAGKIGCGGDLASVFTETR